MGDPSVAWLAQKEYGAKVRELFDLVQNILDNDAKEEIDRLNRSGILRGFHYWRALRVILQKFFSRKNLWARYNTVDALVEHICNELKLDGEFDLRRLRELFVSESTRQKAKLSLHIQPAMRMRSDFKSLDNEFQGLITTVLESHVVGDKLLNAMRKVISCYFIDEVQIEVWMNVLKVVEEKKKHVERQGVKIKRGVKIVVTKKAAKESV